MCLLAVQGIEVHTFSRPAEHHERAYDLFRVAPQRVHEGDAVAQRARHHILALDEAAHEPRLVPHQAEMMRMRGEFLDDRRLVFAASSGMMWLG